MSKGFGRREIPSLKLRNAVKKLKRAPDLSQLVTDLDPKVKKTGQTRILDSTKIFNLNGRLSQALPDIRDRNFLLRRIRIFLSSRRRGKLRLPKTFPREVLHLTSLTKSQLGSFAYWVNPNTSINHRLNERMFDHIARNFPGMVWNSPKSVLEHMVNVVGTLRLRRSDWPGTSRQRWPSTPTFSEMLAMSRRGYSIRGLDKLNYTVPNCITKQRLSDDIRLATRIVANNIVGVRSSVLIPEKFSRWFRYSNGILFLAVRHKLPSGLVRFLLAQWIKCPFSLWLKENCRLKIFLRRHSPTDFNVRDEEVLTERSFTSDSVPLGEGSPDSHRFDQRSIGDLLEEMGEEFSNFFARLPD